MVVRNMSMGNGPLMSASADFAIVGASNQFRLGRGAMQNSEVRAGVCIYWGLVDLSQGRQSGIGLVAVIC